MYKWDNPLLNLISRCYNVEQLESIYTRYSSGYRFTKGLTQNLNLRTNLKLKYNIKSLNYI